MIQSRLERKTAIKSREEWEKRLDRLKPVIMPILEKQPGFQGVEFEWNDDGIVETTSWASDDDHRAYLRGGGAATVATFSDQQLPTAPYPDGNWVRTTPSS